MLRFVPVAFRSEEEVLWRRGPHDLYWPALNPPWGGSDRKTTIIVRDHEYFIPTKFHQNSSSGSWEKVENVKVYRQTDGQRAMKIAHLSLRLRRSKQTQISNVLFKCCVSWAGPSWNMASLASDWLIHFLLSWNPWTEIDETWLEYKYFLFSVMIVFYGHILQQWQQMALTSGYQVPLDLLLLKLYCGKCNTGIYA